jgi:hypothetical protein
VAPLRLANDTVAKKVSDVCLKVFKELEDTVGIVEAENPAEDLKKYRNAVGTVLGALVLDVMGPLYEGHPDIKPDSWKDIPL